MESNIACKGSIALVTVCAIAALTPATPATAGPTAFGPATSIVLERTGGFAGDRTSFVVDRSTVGGQRPLQMAASRQFTRLRPSYQPENPCCDRFFYRLAVSYRSGYRKTISTVQSTSAPRILWDVIDGVEQVGVRPSSAAPAA